MPLTNDFDQPMSRGLARRVLQAAGWEQDGKGGAWIERGGTMPFTLAEAWGVHKREAQKPPARKGKRR